MPTTRTGVKLATEQPPTSDAQRMQCSGYKVNGSGIYTVCVTTVSFTKRLPMVIVDS